MIATTGEGWQQKVLTADEFEADRIAVGKQKRRLRKSVYYPKKSPTHSCPRFRRSFAVRTVWDWNLLPSHVVEQSTPAMHLSRRSCPGWRRPHTQSATPHSRDTSRGGLCITCQNQIVQCCSCFIQPQEVTSVHWFYCYGMDGRTYLRALATIATCSYC